MGRRKGKGLFGIRKDKHQQQQQQQQQQQDQKASRAVWSSSSSSGQTHLKDEKESGSIQQSIPSRPLGQPVSKSSHTTTTTTTGRYSNQQRSHYVSQTDPIYNPTDGVTPASGGASEQHQHHQHHQQHQHPEQFSQDHGTTSRGGGATPTPTPTPTTYMFPPVHVAVEEVWRADTTDFRSGTLALKLLNMSILANHSRWERVTSTNNNGGGGYGNVYSPDLNYDPSEAFLCVQATTEKYLNHWRFLCKERERAVTQAEKRRRRRDEKKRLLYEQQQQQQLHEEELRRKRMLQEEHATSRKMLIQQGGAGVDGVVTDEDDTTTHNDNDGGGGGSTQETLDQSNSARYLPSLNSSQHDTTISSLGSKKAKETKSTRRSSSLDISRSSTKNSSIMSGGDDTDDEEDDFGGFGEELLDDRIFDLCEKEAWQVWHNSLICCASLVTCCVGPAWDHQLRERQEMIRNDTRQTHSYQQHQQQGFLNSRPAGLHRSNSITDESVSTLGTIDSSSLASYRPTQVVISEGHSGVGQSFARNSIYNNTSTGNSMDASDTQSSNHQRSKVKKNSTKKSALKRYPPIPEVLPIAILRFAASFSQNFFPNVLYPSSDVELPFEVEKLLKPGNPPDESFVCHYFDATIHKVVEEEKMWLMRRQEVGVAQQQLILALCCRGDVMEFTADLWSTENDNFDKYKRSEYARDENKVLLWNIPGAHSPVASMLQFWAESAIPGWPNELIGKDRDPIFFNTISRLCKSDDHDNMILGARYSSVFVTWKQVAVLGAPDWEYISEIAILASLLVKRGWRPPPYGRDGEGCVYGLMDLAAKGALLHRADLSSFSSDENSGFQRLLIVQSSAAAFYTLRNLASQGWLPIKTVAPVTKTFCHFLSEMDPTISNDPKRNLFPLHNPSKSELENKELFENIHGACLFHTAQVLWTLLEHESSAVKAIDAVIDVSMPAQMLGSLHFKPEDGQNLVHDPKLLAAVVAIRVLGASLWGDPPMKTGIPHLRIYWSLFLSMIVDICSSLPMISNSQISPIRKPVTVSSSHSYQSLMSDVSIDPGRLECFHSTPTLLPLNNYHPMALTIIHEVIIAVKRLIDGELTSESIEPLCRYEWEPFILLLEKGLLPWLVSALSYLKEAKGNEKSTLPPCHYDSRAKKIMDDIQNIFSQVRDFIFYTDDYPLSVFQSMIDPTSRQRIHILFFRLISPVLPVGDSIFVGTSLIRKWVYGGGVTHRSNEWSKKCYEILSEAFAVYVNDSYGFKGGYVHAPSVRLAAIRAFITRIEANRSCDYELRSISTSSLSSGKSSVNFDQALLARHVNMVHWNDICSILFPFLLESLAFCNSDHNGIVVPDPVVNKTSEIEIDSKLVGSAFDLQQTAIQCLGEMFRSGHLDKENRVLIVDTMHQFACDTTFLVKDNVNTVAPDVTIDSVVGDELISLKIETVWQLGRCLNTPFEFLPQMHSDTPRIASILCQIAKIYSQGSFAFKDEKKVSILALMCLARLRMTTSGKAMLLAKETLFTNLPGSTSILLKDLESSFTEIQVDSARDGASETNNSHEDSHSVASNIFMEASHSDTYKHKYHLDKETRLKRLEGTTFDVHSIIQTVKELICGDPQKNEKWGELQTHIRVLCYEIIKNFTLSGLAIMSASQWIELLSSQKQESAMVHSTELEAICSLIASCAGFIIQYILSSEVESKDILSIEEIYLTTYHFCQGDAVTLASEASRALFLVQVTRSFSSQKHKHTDIWSPAIKPVEHVKTPEQNSTILSNTMKIILERWGNSFENNPSLINRHLEPHLSLLFDILSMKETWPKNQANAIPCEIVKMSFKIVAMKASSQCQLLALQCTALAVDLLNSDQLHYLIALLAGEREDIFSKSHHEQSHQDGFEFQGVILDLIRQEMMCKTLIIEKRLLPKLQIEKLSANETMANDVESLESFITDVAGEAAWVHNDQLLMCRVGARQSRYNGWIEISMRSPVNRIRRLVRLPDSVSLNDPGFPSSLWDIISKSHEKVQNLPLRRSKKLNAHNCILEKLEVKRFSDITENGEQSLGRFSKMDNMSSILLNQPRHAESLGLENKLHGEDLIGIKRSLSAGDLTAKSSSENLSSLPRHEKEFNDEPSSIRSFLKHSLNISERNQADAEEVRKQFLELCYPDSQLDILSPKGTTKKLRRLKWCPQLKRAISILDRVSFLQTHKIALLFDGPASTRYAREKSNTGGKPKVKNNAKEEKHLLGISGASPLFLKFCQKLGSIVPTRHLRHFSGGLDTSPYAADGSFAMAWIDTESVLPIPGAPRDKRKFVGKQMVLFHSIPLMPSGINTRKRHVGNDVVHIIFVEDDIESALHDEREVSISGEFCLVTIYVIPMLETNHMAKIILKTKKDLDATMMESLQHLVGSSIMPFSAAAFYVRQLAVRADLACRSMLQDRLGMFSNWQERIRQIKDLERYA